ncbi:Uncharacterised protein [Mycobacteroides abscessus subsp. abscessus]|nr:Uncharacterised protein [Mycobacteroides abscessus subsp. abscessus]
MPVLEASSTTITAISAASTTIASATPDMRLR